MADSTPFATVLDSLSMDRRTKWSAILASLGSAVLFLCLLPLVYLFVDLLVWRGAMPTYSSLPPHQQERFHTEWDRSLGQNTSILNTLARIRPQSTEAYVSESVRWEWRYQATTYHTLETKVNPESAAAYLRLPDDGDEITQVSAPSGNRLGILSLVARERPRWTSTLAGVVARTNPWAWQPEPMAGANTSYLAGLFIVVFSLTFAFVALLFGAERSAVDASLAASTKLRRNLFSHANRLGQLAIRPQSAREAAELFTIKIDEIQDGLRAWLLQTWRAPVAIVGLTVVLLLVNFWMAVCFLLSGVLVWLMAGQIAAWFRRDARLAAGRSEARLLQMEESVTILQLVKCYLMERFNQTRVERLITEQNRSEWRRLRGAMLSRPAFIAAVSLVGVAILYLAGRSVLTGQMSVAGLVMKIVARCGLASAISSWLGASVLIRRAKDAAVQYDEFLNRRADSGQAIDAEFLQPIERKVDLVELSLREPGTGRMMLEGVSLSIPAGSRLVIFGSDPEELRSLAYLMVRFGDPTGGEIRFDGKNIRWVTLESLRTQVAMVLQQNLIFADTVANNIGCGDPGFSVPQIIEAAKLAHAHQLVQRLPHGYETPIGNGGHSLRPGEQLRIAVARAILRDPSLLVVEEPDQPIDEDSRVLLDDSYERMSAGRTLIIMSRRMSAIQKADQVAVIYKGRLIGVGAHDDLMANNDMYRTLLFKEFHTTAPTV